MKKILIATTAVVFTACVESSATIKDEIAPVITIKWANPATAVQHTNYIDAGATATDNIDTNVIVTTIGDVNTSRVGDYNLTYIAKDKAGNISTASKRVIVVENIEVTHNGSVYGIVASPYTGKIWLDRNLGAMQVCTSFDDALCYGDYYQWGRGYDGHQDKNSITKNSQAIDIHNTDSSFIIENKDWTAIDSSGDSRSSNWSKTDGTSICPLGFRVPTLAEFKIEIFDRNTSKIQNREDAFKSFLVLPSAGLRLNSNGKMRHKGQTGYYRTLSAGSHEVSFFLFGQEGAEGASNDLRAVAESIRCIRD